MLARDQMVRHPLVALLLAPGRQRHHDGLALLFEFALVVALSEHVDRAMDLVGNERAGGGNRWELDGGIGAVNRAGVDQRQLRCLFDSTSPDRHDRFAASV